MADAAKLGSLVRDAMVAFYKLAKDVSPAPKPDALLSNVSKMPTGTTDEQAAKTAATLLPLYLSARAIATCRTAFNRCCKTMENKPKLATYADVFAAEEQLDADSAGASDLALAATTATQAAAKEEEERGAAQKLAKKHAAEAEALKAAEEAAALKLAEANAQKLAEEQAGAQNAHAQKPDDDENNHDIFDEDDNNPNIDEIALDDGMQLQALLEKHDLCGARDGLGGLGVESVSDLRWIVEDDLHSATGLSAVQRRKILALAVPEAKRLTAANSALEVHVEDMKSRMHYQFKVAGKGAAGVSVDDVRVAVSTALKREVGLPEITVFRQGFGGDGGGYGPVGGAGDLMPRAMLQVNLAAITLQEAHAIKRKHGAAGLGDAATLRSVQKALKVQSLQRAKVLESGSGAGSSGEQQGRHGRACKKKATKHNNGAGSSKRGAAPALQI
jgi:hypothetical protein